MANKTRVIVVDGGAAGFFAAIAGAEKLGPAGQVTLYEATGQTGTTTIGVAGDTTPCVYYTAGLNLIGRISRLTVATGHALTGAATTRT